MGPAAAAPAIDTDLKEAAEERYLNYALSVITSEYQTMPNSYS